MSDRPKQDLREISHLFLSGIRERQTGGAPRPQRIGPAQRGDQPVDITPEELAHVRAAAAPPAEQQTVAAVTAVLAAHFDQEQAQRVREYAAHCASAGGRVGLIEADGHEFRLTVYERNPRGAPQSAVDGECAAPIDARRINESLEELAWDVDRWILSVGHGNHSPESREVLRRVGGFMLLSSCDPDGIVAAYRTLKGAADVVRRDARPPLSLALFGAIDAAHAAGTFEKINGVAVQFLAWPVQGEAVVRSHDDVTEHVVLNCRATHDRSQAAAAPQWRILGDFLDRAAAAEAAAEAEIEAEAEAEIAPARPISPPAEPMRPPEIRPMSPPNAVAPPTFPAIASSAIVDDAEEIFELTGGDDAASVLTAVIAGAPQQWIECPVRPPMCDDARLAFSRDRALTLLAVAKKGLGELRAIGQAYQWLSQNRSLIAMALPQLAIDPHQLPRLQLLVDHADASADIIQPMLHTGHVSVMAYRKVRFSGRRGLLLEAA